MLDKNVLRRLRADPPFQSCNLDRQRPAERLAGKQLDFHPWLQSAFSNIPKQGGIGIGNPPHDDPGPNRLRIQRFGDGLRHLSVAGWNGVAVDVEIGEP